MTIPPAKKETILIVEDSELQREAAHAIIESLGYTRILQAKDGIEAMEHLRKNKVDLIISDLDMPGMNGIELLTEVRNSPEHKTIPFIMLTIFDDKGKIVQAAKSGVSDYIIKPIERNTLKVRLKRIFGNQ